MSDISVTKMSSKGQIVIPSDMRQDFKEGEKFIIIRSGKKIILKSANDFDKNLEEDLRFADRTEEALKRYDKGLFRKMSGEDFLEEIEKW